MLDLPRSLSLGARSLTELRAPLGKLAGLALDLLLPLRCVGCSAEGRFICASCEAALPRLEGPYCRACARQASTPTSDDQAGNWLCSWCAMSPLNVDGIRAPYTLAGAARQMVYELKYRGVKAGACDMGRLLAAFLEAGRVTADVLVPVPLHTRRKRNRGYNQAELLAKEVGMRSGISVDAALLRRTRNTTSQVTLRDRYTRRRNTEGAFECASSLESSRVLLIDDVVTTGGTMSACADALRAAGANSVWGLAFARTQDR